MTGIGRSGIALPLSLRTPKTQELLRVVVNFAGG